MLLHIVCGSGVHVCVTLDKNVSVCVCVFEREGDTEMSEERSGRTEGVSDESMDMNISSISLLSHREVVM